MSEIVVTQTRSAIGSKPKHRGTLRALGLGRIGKTNTLPDRPEIRGMIARVPHLVTIGTEEPQGATKANESGEAAGKVQEIVDEVAEEKADPVVPFAGDDAVDAETGEVSETDEEE